MIPTHVLETPDNYLMMLIFLIFMCVSLHVGSIISSTEEDKENNSGRPRLFVALKFAKESLQNLKRLYQECENGTQSNLDSNKCFLNIGSQFKAYISITLDFIKMVIRKYLNSFIIPTDDYPPVPVTIEPEDDYFEEEVPMDCLDVLDSGKTTSGIYTIRLRYPEGGDRTLDVYCDMDTDGGGWTVIQRRGNFTTQERFFRSWGDYRRGFGNITKDFWIGNENLYLLTDQASSAVRFDLEDIKGIKAFAVYSAFKVGGEYSDFQMNISGYIGNAGDSMGRHNGMKFSTVYRDNDLATNGDYECAVLAQSGWWFDDCSSANLNGLYHPGQSDDEHKYIFWFLFRGYECLSSVEIKVKRSDALDPDIFY